LKQVEDAILKQEEEEGQASAELRQLRDDLREVLSIFKASNGRDIFFFFVLLMIECFSR